MSRGLGVHGHTRSGADDESRTRGLGHGVAALCQLSYIRKRCKACHRPVPMAALRQLVKERPPRAVVRSIDRGPVPMRRPVEVKNEKGPDPFGIRASAYRARKDALCASLSRMHLVLRPIQPAIANRDERTLGTGVHAMARRGKPQGGAHERTQTLLGSVCPDDVAWFHGLYLG